MSGPTWKDTTSYSQQKPRGTTPPREYTVESGGLRVVTHQHIHEPGRWFVTCYEVGLEKRRLKALDPEVACSEALEAVQARLEGFLEAVRKIPRTA